MTYQFISYTGHTGSDTCWDDGTLSFEKVCKYLPYFKSAIQVPIYVIGLDLV